MMQEMIRRAGLVAWLSCSGAAFGQDPVPILPEGFQLREPQTSIVGRVEPSSAVVMLHVSWMMTDPQTGFPPATQARFEYWRAGIEDSRSSLELPIPEHERHGSTVLTAQLEGLEPGSPYRYRWTLTTSTEERRSSWEGSFATPSGADSREPFSMVIASCMNRSKFELDRKLDPEIRQRGFPGLDAIRAQAPHLVVFNGDCVYYDHPREPRATNHETMARKWEEQLFSPAMQELLASCATAWLKDDHDHRFNDCDTTGDKEPSSDLGIAVFREQVPVVPPGDDQAPTWRQNRLTTDLEVWYLEGRDHRSPNKIEDGPDKTLWGAKQREWLRSTLLASEATFRIVVSPTPLVGPDDGYKKDNHTNHGGFRHEGDAFHAWAKEHGLAEQGVVLVCGDRHWQYHSVHPVSGLPEFSVGALVEANSRRGRDPGDPKSTDPDALVRQLWSQPKPSGGFLQLLLEPATEAEPEARLDLVFRDEQGAEAHRVTLRR